MYILLLYSVIVLYCIYLLHICTTSSMKKKKKLRVVLYSMFYMLPKYYY